MYVYICVYVFTRMHVHLCGGQRSTLGVIPQLLSIHLVLSGLELNKNIRLGWPERQGSTCIFA